MDCMILLFGKLTRWLEQKCEQAGIDIFAGFPGSEIIYNQDGNAVIGVRTGDQGIDKNGNQIIPTVAYIDSEDNFWMGTDLGFLYFSWRNSRKLEIVDPGL